MPSPVFHHYLPIPDEVFHSGIYVTSVGSVVATPGESYPPIQHPRFITSTGTKAACCPNFP